MNEVIKNPADLDKLYIMDVNITSVSALSTESGFNPTILYGYNLDLGKNTNAYQFNNKHLNCSGVLRFENNFYSYSSVTVGGNTTYITPLNIRVDDKDFYIGTLRNINYIKFQVSSIFDNTQFVPTNVVNSRYNIVLTFREYHKD
jgi:energy-converting hydrogenase Eha subunit F